MKQILAVLALLMAWPVMAEDVNARFLNTDKFIRFGIGLDTFSLKLDPPVMGENHDWVGEPILNMEFGERRGRVRKVAILSVGKIAKFGDSISAGGQFEGGPSFFKLFVGILGNYKRYYNETYSDGRYTYFSEGADFSLLPFVGATLQLGYMDNGIYISYKTGPTLGGRATRHMAMSVGLQIAFN